MLFAFITLFTALSMAGVAAWFAIAGIMAVFSGAATPALIMGVVIELGKLVGVSWLYRNWKERTKLKYAMLPLVVIAMFLTSMGIFGFLSKAHIEQSAPVSGNVSKIERLDLRIEREKGRIEDAQRVIDQLDETVNTLIEYDKISGPDGARAVRAGQEEQREALRTTIEEAENNISSFEDQKLELSQELQTLAVEVGPVRYIAELIYEDAESRLEDAVRMVIIAFIFVFDPMAILLLMAANYNLMKLEVRKKGKQDPGPYSLSGDLPPTAPTTQDNKTQAQPKRSNIPTKTFRPNASTKFVPAKPEQSTDEAGNHGIKFPIFRKSKEDKKDQ